MIFKSDFSKTEGRWPGHRLSGVLILVLVCLSGCLTRTQGPVLPYVKPAQSIQPADPGPVHLAARLEEMEAELHRLRDMIERAQAGGNDRIVKNLQDRVAFIERQIGVEPAKDPGTPVTQVPPVRDLRQQPAPVQDGFSTPQKRQEMPQPVNSPTQKIPGQEQPLAQPGPQDVPHVSQPVEQPVPTGALDIRNPPVPPEERFYREAYQLFKNGAYDQAIAQFEEFVRRNPKGPLAADAVYWIGEAQFGKGNFDAAVLQFDKVVREYPGSKKELNALLKQGQAFEKMGDNKSARIIYRKIVADQPHTAQGRIAGTRLKQLPREE
jgi:tol-pal system protein YbgF